jgi:hypothetical protein
MVKLYATIVANRMCPPIVIVSESGQMFMGECRANEFDSVLLTIACEWSILVCVARLIGMR